MGIRQWVGRHRKVVIASAVALVVIAAFGLYWFQPWKLFTHSTVNEALPTVATSAQPVTPGPVATSPGTTPAPTESPSESSEAPTVSQPAPAELTSPASMMQEATTRVTPADPVELASGQFAGQEHPTSGNVAVLQLDDGTRFVRLENFSTSDGPDVHIWLSDQVAGGDWHSYDDARFLDLGSLKATDGNQNYEVPAGAELAGFVSVVVV